MRGQTKRVRGQIKRVRGQTKRVRGQTKRVRGQTKRVRGQIKYYCLSGQIFDWCSHAFTTCTGTTPAGTQMYMQNKTNIFYRRQ